jgi:hypothetical protein
LISEYKKVILIPLLFIKIYIVVSILKFMNKNIIIIIASLSSVLASSVLASSVLASSVLASSVLASSVLASSVLALLVSAL